MNDIFDSMCVFFLWTIFREQILFDLNEHGEKIESIIRIHKNRINTIFDRKHACLFNCIEYWIKINTNIEQIRKKETHNCCFLLNTMKNGKLLK